MKILHLDLSDLYRSVIKKACEEFGADYTGVETIVQLFDTIEKERPNAILTSLGLEIELKELVTRISEKAGGVFIPVFVVSSDADVPESTFLFHSGIMGAFSKKDSPDKIIREVNNFIYPVESDLDLDSFRVAIIEDSPVECQLMTGYLRRMGLVHIDKFAGVSDILAKGLDYEFFLIDYVLESGNADELIRKVRSEVAEAVIIVVSGVPQEEIIVRALTIGADDYIHKPFGLDLLKARVYAHLRNLNLIREIRKREFEILQVHKNLLSGIEIARELQVGWIPSEFPNDDYLRVDGAYLPMDELGGDFYDYYQVDEKHYYFLMTDVSGHGVSSALITSMLKLVFQNNAQTIDGPDLMMMTLNRSLYSALGDRGYFVTSVCLYLDLEDKKLSLACAGHPDILWQRGKEVYRLPEGKRDQILGFNPGVLYRTWDDTFQSGDRFFIYTDGIIETMNDQDELYEEDRLIQLLIENANAPFEDLKEIILRSLKDFRGGGQQSDDITLVVIQIQ